MANNADEEERKQKVGRRLTTDYSRMLTQYTQCHDLGPAFAIVVYEHIVEKSSGVVNVVGGAT